MQETISDLIIEQQLKCLRHVGRMDEERLPKRMLFGLCHEMKQDERMLLNRIWELLVWEIGGMSCTETGETGSSFVVKVWRECQRQGRDNECPANNQSRPSNLQCTCGRSFCRQGDLTRHERFCSH